MPINMGTQRSLDQLDKAKEALEKDDTATALILADQALELFLKNCCIFLGATEKTTVVTPDGKERPFNRWGFVESMTFLDKHKFLTSEEKSNFFMFHNWRNPVQHVGLEPSRKQVEMVIAIVEDFIQSQIEARKQVVVTPPVLRRFIKAIRELDAQSSIAQIDLTTNQIRYNKGIVQHRKITKLTDEELVRAYLVTKLVTNLGYSCKAIELENPYKIGRKEKVTEARTDIMVRKNGRCFMIFEVKRPSSYDEELEASIETQLYPIAYLEDPQGRSIRYLIYYTADTTEEAGIVEKFTSIDFRKYRTYDEWVADGRSNLMMIPKEYGLVRKPIYIKGTTKDLRTNVTRKELDGIRWSLHNILYGGGKYQTELFFNLLGLFLAKIYDEKTTAENEAYQYQIAYKDGELESPDEVYAKVDGLYRSALEKFLGYSEEELNKVTGIVFDAPKVKYVVDLLQSISLTSNTYDVLGDFFEKIVWGEFKQSKGQYLTHPNLVNFIIRALNLEELAVQLINEEQKLPYIIDSACGSGTFLIEAMKFITSYVLNHSEKLKKSQSVRELISSNFPLERENKWAEDFTFGIEINKDLAMATKVNMVMHGDGSGNIEAKDALISFKAYTKPKLKEATTKDVYSKPVNENFDVAISNPPFSIMIDRETAEQLPENFIWGEKIAHSLKKQKKKKEVNVETLFLERWYQFLKPKGRLGVVLPESIFDTTENLEVRLFIYKFFNVKAIISLPPLAFQPYTSTKTSLLIAQKKTLEEVRQYQQLWEKYEKEFEALKKRIKAIIKEGTVGLEPFVKNRKIDIVDLLRKYLRNYFDESDSTLPFKDLVQKYEKDVAKVKKEWWVFGEVAKLFNYPIFMAHADEIGYKRTIRGEQTRPNELFRRRKDGEIIVFSEELETILEQLRDMVKWA